MVFVAQSVSIAPETGAQHTTEEPRPRYAIERFGGTLRLKGELRVRDTTAIWKRLTRSLAGSESGTLEVLSEFAGVVSFFGSMVVAAAGVLRKPKSGNLGEIPAIVERAGMDAVPIVLLLHFPLGFVMGFQAARQLETYGGSIYVADLVGISVTRELAPLMRAIIVCGRSEAAFAAELGTIRVSQEMDALRSMGVGPVRYLVLPRTVALLIVVPVLTLLGDIVGVLGGLVVAVTTLKLTATAYLTESSLAITASESTSK